MVGGFFTALPIVFRIQTDSDNIAPKGIFATTIIDIQGSLWGEMKKTSCKENKTDHCSDERRCHQNPHSIVHNGSEHLGMKVKTHWSKRGWQAKRCWKAQILSCCSPGNGYRLSAELEADKLHMLFFSKGDVFKWYQHQLEKHWGTLPRNFSYS